jgi:type IV pilus biogenesis protein CpaD/CtpE
MRISPILPLLAVATAALTACVHNTDSVAKLNAIPFGDINESNIAAMVVHPADLVRGHGQDQVDGTTAVAPVQRLLTDHAKTLPNPGGPDGGGGSSGGSGSSGGGGASGG